MIYEIDEKVPKVDSNVYLAPGSILIGDIEIQKNVSVWFNVSVRADNDSVFIGEGTNIQEGSIIHVDASYPVNISNNVTVGHKCIIHGCTIEEDTMIGMGAIILNGAIIKKGAIVAAGAVVGEGQIVDDYTLVAGVPAKFIKNVGNELSERVKEGTKHYINNGQKYKEAKIY